MTTNQKPPVRPPAQAPAQASAVESDLFELRNIIGLASFAAEARRVLLETHLVADCIPEFDEKLSRFVEHRSQWLESPDCLSDVLNDAYKRLNVLLGDV